VCCLVILQGKSALCFDCRGDGVDSDLTAFKGSSSPGHLPTSPLAMEEEASSNFIRTAKMERAALNGSHGFFVVTGKDIPSIPSYRCAKSNFFRGYVEIAVSKFTENLRYRPNHPCRYLLRAISAMPASSLTSQTVPDWARAFAQRRLSASPAAD